jgi:rhodanese-related sulfurtransferase
MVDGTIGNTSQHLQKMLGAGLIHYKKDGVSRIYSLTNTKVLDVWLALQNLAFDLIPQSQEDEEELCPPEICTSLQISEILKQVKAGKAVLIDARTLEESENTPVAGAIHIPSSQINKRLVDFPKSKSIFVFCRGRYCTLANPAVILLRQKGYKAFRIKETSYEINKAT